MPKKKVEKEQDSTTSAAETAMPVPSSVAHPAAPSAHQPDDASIHEVGPFLSSLNNYERLWAAENSVEGYQAAKDAAAAGTGSRRQVNRLNNQVRQAVGAELSAMVEEGSVSGGAVIDTYQSAHDHDDDFGAETALEGVWGNEYVLHGHYNADGSVKGDSMGLKRSDDRRGQRLAGGRGDSPARVDDALASRPDALRAAEEARRRTEGR